MKSRPNKVTIKEVGPRDGLQNIEKSIATDDKVALINKLSETGLTSIECTSFVSPKAIPQLADNQAVYAKIHKREGLSYPVLVPNRRGLEDAMQAGVNEIAIFTSTSDTFTQNNIGMSVEQSLSEFATLAEITSKQSIRLRAYLSCLFACPYEGNTATDTVLKLCERLLEMGCYEVSLGDTTGVGTPGDVHRVYDRLCERIDPNYLAGHYHNTYGQALANIYATLDYGVATYDAALAGLGGCPYARGATGNVATEDVVYMLHGLGIETGVDIAKLCTLSREFTSAQQLSNRSSVTVATQGLS